MEIDANAIAIAIAIESINMPYPNEIGKYATQWSVGYSMGTT